MDRFAVVGLGRFGYRLAVMLANSGAEVIAVDSNRDVIEEIRDRVTLAICMDGTDENALKTQGLDKVDVAVVGIGQDFEASLLSTVILKQLGIKRVISRASTEIRGEILRRVGADALVNPEDEAAYRWCHRLLGPHIIEQIELAEGHSLVQVPAPSDWIGQTLANLDVRKRYQVNVVAILRTAAHDANHDGGPIIEVPLPTSLVTAGDRLIVIGEDQHISALPG